jgi:ferritin-like metal-binding protein YciE
MEPNISKTLGKSRTMKVIREKLKELNDLCDQLEEHDAETDRQAEKLHRNLTTNPRIERIDKEHG